MARRIVASLPRVTRTTGDGIATGVASTTLGVARRCPPVRLGPVSPHGKSDVVAAPLGICAPSAAVSVLAGHPWAVVGASRRQRIAAGTN